MASSRKGRFLKKSEIYYILESENDLNDDSGDEYVPSSPSSRSSSESDSLGNDEDEVISSPNSARPEQLASSVSSKLTAPPVSEAPVHSVSSDISLGIFEESRPLPDCNDAIICSLHDAQSGMPAPAVSAETPVPYVSTELPATSSVLTEMPASSVSTEPSASSISSEMPAYPVSSETPAPSVSSEQQAPSALSEMPVSPALSEMPVSPALSEMPAPSISSETPAPSVSSEPHAPSVSSEMPTPSVSTDLLAVLVSSEPSVASLPIPRPSAATATAYPDNTSLDIFEESTTASEISFQVDGKKKKTSKRKRNTSEWLINKRRKASEEGKEHINNKKKLIPARKVMNVKDCLNKCKFKCSSKILSEERQKIFACFYSLTHNEKKSFIVNNTSMVSAKRSKNPDSVRKNSFSYFFSLDNVQIRICKMFFLTTLNISQKIIYNAHLTKDETTGIIKRDTRGKGTQEKLGEEKSFVRSHINSFPRVESHYCRSRTAKEYLESELSVSKMHSLYTDACSSKDFHPVKESMYRHIFKSEYNIGFHKPKSDRCDLCEEMKVKQKQGILTVEEKCKLDLHLKHKLAMREEREKDRKIKSNTTAVICFDLQNVITCPKVEISSFFYKRKLNVYNLTAHCVVDGKKTAYCVLWNECTSKRGGNEIASCLMKIFEHVLSVHKDVKNIITWSDSCVSQNRNSFMTCAVIQFLSQHQNIENVVMKYSIPGHSSVQEVDNIHSQLEKSFSVAEFFSPLSLLRIILKTNRTNPFIVIQLKSSDIKDYKKAAEMLDFKQIPYTKVASLVIENSFQIKFKTSHDVEESLDIKNVSNVKRTRSIKTGRPIIISDVLKEHNINKCLAPIPLPPLKKKDLQDMIKFMPVDDRSYFQGLFRI